jgi:hypothetical protein
MDMVRQNKLGSLLAAIHLIMFFWFLYYLDGLSSRDGQGPLLWVYWLVIDFPVSLLVILLFAVDITSHYMLYFVHGILGTIWWFYLPTALYKGFKRRPH